VSHYSNPDLASKLQVTGLAAREAVRHTRASLPRRPRPRKLSADEVTEVVAAYLAGGRVVELAARFGIRRQRVSELLARESVTLRPVGLKPGDIASAVRLYQDGWSVARLGAQFGVDGTTVWRALKAGGVVMRSPNDRC
jgi:hypothetical protein